MAVKYARLRALVEVSDASDYSKAKIHQIEADETPDEYRLADLYEVGTTAQTYTLNHLTSNTMLVVENLNTSNTVLLTARVEKATKTFAANKLGFNDANPDTITDDDSTFVSALYFAAGDLAVVSGAAEAGNNGTFLVQVAAAGTLTLANAVTLTVDADDAGTPAIASRRDITVPIGPGRVVVLGSVVVGSDLTLQAVTAACEVEISYLGT